MKYLFSILAIFAFTFTALAQEKKDNPNAPIFRFNEETHDFGTLKEGPVAEYVFEFTNVGKEPLIIQNCSASCGCTTPDWTKDPIMPGKKGKITVKYNTQGRPGGFNKTVYIQSNAKSEKDRYELHIKGTVTAAPKPATTQDPTPDVKH
ncbi:MAG: DUF1573 domain-containing protein [Chitinophagaceae bacterium]